MNTVNAQPVTDNEQHQLEMLLWHAEIHERNGKKQEAFKIRDWVADFLNPQPEEKRRQLPRWKEETQRRAGTENQDPLGLMEQLVFHSKTQQER